MKVLIVGSGGREHAIAWSVAKSPKVDKIYCAPGNAGIAEFAECVNIKAMEFDKLVAFAKENAIDLTIIGMDDPLVGGVVDAFESEGLRVFGPRKNAAIIEGSKAFSKDLMKKYHIPTAAYENFTDPDAAIAYLENAKFPIVLKADGLALGKGVLICQDLEEAKAGVKEIMLDKKFGSAGNEMVIEEFMTGREVSVLSFVDGKTIRTMTSAQDHKRAMDGDKGLNTGGMGTFSPSPFYTKEVEDFCNKYVYQATVDAMKAERFPFDFVLTSTFRLEGKTIHHTLTVENPGQEELRFGIGFHPAFNIPFDDCHTTEDYEFRFDQPESPVIIDARPHGLLSGRCYYKWKNAEKIQLTDELFSNDSFCMAGLRTKTLGSAAAKSPK